MVNYTFALREPVSSYHPTIQVGRYDTLATSVVAAGKTIPLRFGGAGSVSTVMVDHTKSSLQYFSGLYGDYPFTSCGGVSASGNWNGLWGQETVTSPTYSPKELASKGGPGLVAHEVAHHWFGNSVTAASWKDMPLIHEGLAVLLEKDYCETHGGLFSSYKALPSTLAANPGRGFYRWNEAYGVMRELRYRMDGTYSAASGSAFTGLLSDLASQYRTANVTRAQFMRLAESRSPVSLSAFWRTYRF